MGCGASLPEGDAPRTPADLLEQSRQRRAEADAKKKAQADAKKAEADARKAEAATKKAEADAKKGGAKKKAEADAKKGGAGKKAKPGKGAAAADEPAGPQYPDIEARPRVWLELARAADNKEHMSYFLVNDKTNTRTWGTMAPSEAQSGKIALEDKWCDTAVVLITYKGKSVADFAKSPTCGRAQFTLSPAPAADVGAVFTVDKDMALTPMTGALPDASGTKVKNLDALLGIDAGGRNANKRRDKILRPVISPNAELLPAQLREHLEPLGYKADANAEMLGGLVKGAWATSDELPPAFDKWTDRERQTKVDEISKALKARGTKLAKPQLKELQGALATLGRNMAADRETVATKYKATKEPASILDLSELQGVHFHKGLYYVGEWLSKFEGDEDMPEMPASSRPTVHNGPFNTFTQRTKAQEEFSPAPGKALLVLERVADVDTGSGTVTESSMYEAKVQDGDLTVCVVTPNQKKWVFKFPPAAPGTFQRIAVPVNPGKYRIFSRGNADEKLKPVDTPNRLGLFDAWRHAKVQFTSVIVKSGGSAGIQVAERMLSISGEGCAGGFEERSMPDERPADVCEKIIAKTPTKPAPTVRCDQQADEDAAPPKEHIDLKKMETQYCGLLDQAAPPGKVLVIFTRKQHIDPDDKSAHRNFTVSALTEDGKRGYTNIDGSPQGFQHAKSARILWRKLGPIKLYKMVKVIHSKLVCEPGQIRLLGFNGTDKDWTTKTGLLDKNKKQHGCMITMTATAGTRLHIDVCYTTEDKKKVNTRNIFRLDEANSGPTWQPDPQGGESIQGEYDIMSTDSNTPFETLKAAVADHTGFDPNRKVQKQKDAPQQQAAPVIVNMGQPQMPMQQGYGQPMPGQMMPGYGQPMPGQMMPGQMMPGQMPGYGQPMQGQMMPGQMPGYGQPMQGQMMQGQMMQDPMMQGQMPAQGQMQMQPSAAA
ncbi:unnamed protein product [Pedinophyceae sp. YPF-701]|nr:unnamed protein product [Pedinophyceae sp. YPF-701]